ncbi:hypothetical protein ACTMU2_25250 [Cupriavidus basilensis]
MRLARMVSDMLYLAKMGSESAYHFALHAEPIDVAVEVHRRCSSSMMRWPRTRRCACSCVARRTSWATA